MHFGFMNVIIVHSDQSVFVCIVN